MRKLAILLGLSVVVLLVSVGVANAQPPGTLPEQTAEADLAEIDDSGVTAHISFEDTGGQANDAKLIVHGRARGLDPDASYVTLRYDVLSPSEGEFACEPVIPPGVAGSLTFDQMFVGQWKVDEDGRGTLDVRLSGKSYTPIHTFGNVSVRKLLGQFNPSGPPPPTKVVACGDVSPPR